MPPLEEWDKLILEDAANRLFKNCNIPGKIINIAKEKVPIQDDVPLLVLHMRMLWYILFHCPILSLFSEIFLYCPCIQYKFDIIVQCLLK